MQKFPTNLVLCIRSDAELKLVVGALSEKISALKKADAPDAPTLAAITDNAKLTDDTGVAIEIPDAYVEVGGRKMAEGSVADMSGLFNAEIVAHSGTVALFVRDGLEYKQSRLRRANRG